MVKMLKQKTSYPEEHALASLIVEGRSKISQVS